jgi:hypothetical protein
LRRTSRGRSEARLQIDMGDQKPVGPLYRVSALELHTLRKQLKELVDKGMIRSSSSLGVRRYYWYARRMGAYVCAWNIEH